MFCCSNKEHDNDPLREGHSGTTSYIRVYSAYILRIYRISRGIVVFYGGALNSWGADSSAVVQMAQWLGFFFASSGIKS